MKKFFSRIHIDQIVAAFVAFSGFLGLAFDEIFKPEFIDSRPLAKQIVILISAFMAYHALHSYFIRSIVHQEIEVVTNAIKNVESKIQILNESVSYSELDDIEHKHGYMNKKTECEIWIISNTLQEAHNDDQMLNVIYDNVAKNRIRYYYVLPSTEKSRSEIASLRTKLNEIHKRHRGNLNGSFMYRYDDNLLKTITTDYFDVVLFVDLDKDGNPSRLGSSSTCEGFQCFSNCSDNNAYFYQRIEFDKILEIRSTQSCNDYELLEIGN